MTNNTNKSDNELIAEFMGHKVSAVCNDGTVFLASEYSGLIHKMARYHLSWDELMPVVEKMSEFGVWTLRPGFAAFENHHGELRKSHQFKYIKSIGDFEEVNGEPVSWVFITACVALDGIKWYNSQSKQAQP